MDLERPSIEEHFVYICAANATRASYIAFTTLAARRVWVKLPQAGTLEMKTKLGCPQLAGRPCGSQIVQLAHMRHS